jgi:lipopolysaccharide biosynthesis glycosyltransferase
MLNYENISYKSRTCIISYILRILILIFFLLLLKISVVKKNKNNKNNKNYNNRYSSIINGNYSLYDSFKYPQISIIIPDIDILALKNNIFKLMMSLKNQTLNNIEIILTSTKTEFKEYKKLENLCLKDKRIKLIKIKRKEPINNLFFLMKILKGKFVLILNKYFDFKRNDFENFYQFTIGKIKNIFEFKKKRESLFLIKSKILRDINDNNINFENFSSLIEYITSLPEPKLNYISIALSTSNKYISIIYVCMTSILYSKNAYTYIIFYLLIPKGFFQKNIDFLKTLHEQYDYFNISFIEIDNRYDKAFISRHITKEAYFKFSLGELIPHLNKIIYLDNDVIVFKDLTTIFQEEKSYFWSTYLIFPYLIISHFNFFQYKFVL